MSRSLKREPRRPNDGYMTPRWAIRAVLPKLSLYEGMNILEPCAGDGAVLAELQDVGQDPADLFAVELDADIAASTQARFPGVKVRCQDALALPDTLDGRFDLVITNPPYKLAWEILHRAFKLVEPGGQIVLLLRLNFLASQKRAEWMRDNAPDVYVLPRRPSFTGGGTDATEYAWMVWTVPSSTGAPRRAGKIEVLPLSVCVDPEPAA